MYQKAGPSELVEYQDSGGPNDLDSIMDDTEPVRVTVTNLTAAMGSLPVDVARRQAIRSQRSAEVRKLMASQGSRKKGGGSTITTRTMSSRLLDIVEEQAEEHPLFDMVFCFSAGLPPPDGGDAATHASAAPTTLRCTMHEDDAKAYLNARPRPTAGRRGCQHLGKVLASKLFVRRMRGWPWLPPAVATLNRAALNRPASQANVQRRSPADMVPGPRVPAEFEGMPGGQCWGAVDASQPDTILFLTLPHLPVPKVPQPAPDGEYHGVAAKVALQNAAGEPAGPGWDCAKFHLMVRWQEDDDPTVQARVRRSAAASDGAPSTTLTAATKLGAVESDLALCASAGDLWRHLGCPPSLGVQSVMLFLERDVDAANQLAGAMAKYARVTQRGDKWVLSIEAGGEE